MVAAQSAGDAAATTGMRVLLSPPSAYQNLPPPADAAQARLGFVRWHEAAAEADDPALAAFMHRLAEDATGNQLLASLFGNSPFLTQCCLGEPRLLMRLLQDGPDATFAELDERLNRHLAAGEDRPMLMRALRVAKRQAALLIAIADIAGWWPLERVTGALSAFAEAALGAVVRHLLAAAASAGEVVLADAVDPARGSGFIVLGMGKLGARELN